MPQGSIHHESVGIRAAGPVSGLRHGLSPRAYEVALIPRPGLCRQASEDTTLPPPPGIYGGPMEYAARKTDFRLIRERWPGDPAVPLPEVPSRAPEKPVTFNLAVSRLLVGRLLYYCSDIREAGMDRKAHENLEAARLLLAQEHACTNAAASRAYYAAYQACWAAMVDRGIPVPQTERGEYFPHKMLPSQARRAGLFRDEDEQEDLIFLESQRVVADYSQEDVTLRSSRECLGIATRLVNCLLSRLS